jgi:hypothetical protein
MSLFAAAWTVACIKSLAERGAEAVTLFETTGWRGVMENEDGPPMPDHFPSLPGCVFPVYHVLAALGDFAGAEILGVDSCLPLQVQALALRRPGATRLLVANMMADEVEAELQGLTRAASLKLLDERNAERAMREPEAFVAEPPDSVSCPEGVFELSLLPYAVAIIDLEEDSGG